MRSLATCSGPWTGFWIQETFRGAMALRLRIAGTRMMGDGEDKGGKFAMVGLYDPATETVQIDKWYEHQVVEYVGNWDGHMISGFWVSDYGWTVKTGEFEMWPLKDDEERRIEAEHVVLEEPIAIGVV